MQLVLLHALPLDRRMWDRTLRAFPGQTLAPNLWGLGDSLETWAPAVVEQVGTEEFIVVGCSVGGSCALEVARAAPDQVAAIVLVGAKAGVNPDPVLRDEAVRLLETEGMEAAWSQYWLPLFADTTPAPIKKQARSWAMDQDIAAVANGVRAFHDRRDLTQFAASWPKPLIGISGAQDVAPVPAKLRQITTGPRRVFHLVPECGHYLNLEQPDAFSAVLSNAIRSVTAGTRYQALE